MKSTPCGHTYPDVVDVTQHTDVFRRYRCIACGREWFGNPVKATPDGNQENPRR